MARKSKGRQKIEMKIISKESNLFVTFSKRRSGLFKKASELCTMCSVEIAIIIFSPGKKAFSFGHPTVESIVYRFLTRNAPVTGDFSTLQLVEAHRNASMHELNMQFTLLLKELEEQRNRGEELTQMRKENREKFWWESPLEDLGLQELEQLKGAMELLKKNIANEAEKFMVEASMNPVAHLRASASSGSSAGGIVEGNVSGGIVEGNVSGLGLSVTPHGYALGHGCGFY